MSDPFSTNTFRIIIVIIAVSFAYWCYRDAKARDYSGVLWCFAPLISLLFPIFIVIPYLIILLSIYLLVRPKGRLIKCPHCKKDIYEILFQCPFCKKNAKRECIHCLEPVPWEAEQCPYCKSRALTKGN